MANFAKLGIDNVVLEVRKINNIDTMNDDGEEKEEIGVEYLKRLTGHETWVQCSFNTAFGNHGKGKTPFRKNYPNPGYTYDSKRDAFIQDKPYDSWLLNEQTCRWEPPIEKPAKTADKRYKWDESVVNWLEIPKSEWL